MHEGQTRHSGEANTYMHPVAVAAILTKQRLDDATIITALLHDTIEDTRASYADIERLFSKEVAELVDGVTKLTNLQLNSTETKQAENFRKLFMAMSKDPCGNFGQACGPAAQHAHDQSNARGQAGARKRARPWIFLRRLPAVWACSGCAKNWKIWRLKF